VPLNPQKEPGLHKDIKNKRPSRRFWSRLQRGELPKGKNKAESRRREVKIKGDAGDGRNALLNQGGACLDHRNVETRTAILGEISRLGMFAFWREEGRGE